MKKKKSTFYIVWMAVLYTLLALALILFFYTLRNSSFVYQGVKL